jgi:hypothetical protein
LGWPSSHEHDQERREAAAFDQSETADDLKALLTAAAEPQKFERHSAPAPKLKKSKSQLATERKYRERQYKHSVSEMNRLALETEIERLRAENEELRGLLIIRIDALKARSNKR